MSGGWCSRYSRRHCMGSPRDAVREALRRTNQSLLPLCIFFHMARHWSAQVGRTLFAILAVWCLGCSSFDILVEQLSASAVTPCTDESRGSSPSENGAANVLMSVASSDKSTMSGNCGCTHCVGVEPVVFAVVVPHRPMPEAFQKIIENPMRISTEPAVPPPQVSFIA